MLADERIVGAQATFVRAVGLARAVVLQQIHYNAVNPRIGEDHDGHRWYAVTAFELADEIGLSESAIQRAVRALEDDRLLLSCQPEGWSSRRKWYRVNVDHPLVTGSDQPAESSDGTVSHLGDTPTWEDGDTPSSHPGDTPTSSSTSSRRTTNFDELPLVPESGGADGVPHGTSRVESPRGDPDAERAKTVASRTAAGRALRATGRGGGKPRRTDPRADGLVREWWEAQPTPPNQAWPAAVGVVSKALKNGVSEERLRAALRKLDSPLSGGRLDYALGQLGKSRRAEDQGTAGWRDMEPGEIIL